MSCPQEVPSTRGRARLGAKLNVSGAMSVRLREAVRLIVASRRPLAIAWGSDWRLLANESFVSLTGARASCRGAGVPVREAHSELALWLEPLLHRVSRDGGWVAAEDKLICVYRHGYAEETYLSTCCSRLTDDGEDWCGILISIDESTERVLGARRSAALRDIAAASLHSAGVSESCTRVFDALAGHAEEIPFALLYLRDGDDLLRLAAGAHVEPGGRASPDVIPIINDQEPFTWPIADALSRDEALMIDDVRDRFGVMPAGDWPFAPRCALVQPVTCPGSERPAGIFIAGVSARRAPNAEHRAFIELVVKQIGAVVAAGRAHEAAEHHAILRAAARQRNARRRARVRALKARFAGVLDERTRLAREIHDTLLHGITGVALQLRAVLPHVAQNDSCGDALHRILALAERTSHEARQAVWDIRPNVPGGDLVRALQAAVRQLVDGSDVRTRLAVIGRARGLNADQQDTVLRVAQEAVANVLRHAAARAIRLRLRYSARRLVFTVMDDGAGFVVADDPQAYAGHWGLVGMRERAERVGGEVRVSSTPGSGTTVRLVVPLQRRTRSPA